MPLVLLHRLLERGLELLARRGEEGLVVVEADEVEDQLRDVGRARSQERLGAAGALLEVEPDDRGLAPPGDAARPSSRPAHAGSPTAAAAAVQTLQEVAAADAPDPIRRRPFGVPMSYLHLPERGDCRDPNGESRRASRGPRRIGLPRMGRRSDGGRYLTAGRLREPRPGERGRARRIVRVVVRPVLRPARRPRAPHRRGRTSRRSARGPPSRRRRCRRSPWRPAPAGRPRAPPRAARRPRARRPAC